MSQKGRRYETELCSDIYEESDRELFPLPIGYSGNHTIPSPDVLIDDGMKMHAIELKRVGGNRESVVYDMFDTEKDDIYQLLTFARQYPRTVVPYVGVRFDRRQLILTKLWLGGPNDATALRSAANTAPTDVRLTHDDNLSFHKPSTDEWSGASAGDDAEYVLDTIGYTNAP